MPASLSYWHDSARFLRHEQNPASGAAADRLCNLIQSEANVRSVP
jgi:hypothetical protein